jgi:hypothetical protein
MFQPSSDLDLCGACALRVASPSEGIWAYELLPAETAAPDVAGAETAARLPSRKCSESDRALEEFKRAVAIQIPENDADSHLNLAAAYSAMGLFVDARREAAIAITADATAKATNAALRLLLTAPLLPDDALDRLRERLRRPVN